MRAKLEVISSSDLEFLFRFGACLSLLPRRALLWQCVPALCFFVLFRVVCDPCAEEDWIRGDWIVICCLFLAFAAGDWIRADWFVIMLPFLDCV